MQLQLQLLLQLQLQLLLQLQLRLHVTVDMSAHAPTTATTTATATDSRHVCNRLITTNVVGGVRKDVDSKAAIVMPLCTRPHNTLALLIWLWVCMHYHQCATVHIARLQCLRHPSLSECVYMRGGLMGGEVWERVCLCMRSCYVCVWVSVWVLVRVRGAGLLVVLV